MSFGISILDASMREVFSSTCKALVLKNKIVFNVSTSYTVLNFNLNILASAGMPAVFSDIPGYTGLSVVGGYWHLKSELSDASLVGTQLTILVFMPEDGTQTGSDYGMVITNGAGEVALDTRSGKLLAAVGVVVNPVPYKNSGLQSVPGYVSGMHILTQCYGYFLGSTYVEEATSDSRTYSYYLDVPIVNQSTGQWSFQPGSGAAEDSLYTDSSSDPREEEAFGEFSAWLDNKVNTSSIHFINGNDY